MKTLASFALFLAIMSGFTFNLYPQVGQDDPDVISGWGQSGYLSKFTGPYSIVSSGLYQASNNNFGIGTTIPGYKLHVNGTFNANSIYQNGTPIVSSQWTTASGNIYFNTGNVGIGTTTISEKLHVAGNIQSSANDANHSFALMNTTNNKAWRMIQLNSTDSQSPNGLLFEHQTAPGSVIRYMSLSQWGNLGISNNLTIDLTSKTSSAGRDALIINASADNTAASFITNKPGFYFWSSEGHSADISARNIFLDGSMGIGTSSVGSFKLAVEGKIGAREIVVQTGAWADFVFENNYKLMPLNELEKSIKANKHLPGIPTEKEVLANGVSLGEMQAKLLQKVEELTLYVIDLKKENDQLKKQMDQLTK